MGGRRTAHKPEAQAMEYFDTPRSSPPHFELTRYEACGLRLILVIRGRRYSMHESIVLCPACRRQANPSEFRANRRKSKSRRLQFVVVMSEECQDLPS